MPCPYENSVISDYICLPFLKSKRPLKAYGEAFYPRSNGAEYMPRSCKKMVWVRSLYPRRFTECAVGGGITLTAMLGDVDV